MKKLVVIALAIAMVFAFAACGSKTSSDHGDVVAVINGSEVYEDEYLGYLGSYYQSAYGNYSMYQTYYGVDLLNEEGSEEMFGSMEYYAWNVMVQASLIRDLAKEYGVEFKETFLEDWLPYGYLMGIKTSILYNDLVEAIQAQLQSEADVSEEDIENAYYEDPESWDGRKTSHILIMCDTEDEAAKAEAYQKAVDLIARLDAGEDFATLAKENSDDGSASNGGSIDAYINVNGYEVGTENSFYAEYVQAAYQLSEVGEYSSEPVLSSAGYHIIRIDDIRAGLEANHDVIAASLSEVSSDDAASKLGDIITERTNSADIQIKKDIYKYYVEMEEPEGEGAEGETEDGTLDELTEEDLNNIEETIDETPDEATEEPADEATPEMY